MGRYFLGGVSPGVLHAGRCSVRVACGGLEEPGTPIRLIIVVDGSPRVGGGQYRGRAVLAGGERGAPSVEVVRTHLE